MDQSTWAEQGVESRRDNDGGKHERYRGQGTQKGFAAKVKAGEEVGGGESEEECEQGGEDGLVKSEAQNVKGELEVIAGEGVEIKSESKDFGKRKEEKNGQEGKRKDPENSSS